MESENEWIKEEVLGLSHQEQVELMLAIGAHLEFYAAMDPSHFYGSLGFNDTKN